MHLLHKRRQTQEDDIDQRMNAIVTALDEPSKLKLGNRLLYKFDEGVDVKNENIYLWRALVRRDKTTALRALAGRLNSEELKKQEKLEKQKPNKEKNNEWSKAIQHVRSKRNNERFISGIEKRVNREDKLPKMLRWRYWLRPRAYRLDRSTREMFRHGMNDDSVLQNAKVDSVLQNAKRKINNARLSNSASSKNNFKSSKASSNGNSNANYNYLSVKSASSGNSFRTAGSGKQASNKMPPSRGRVALHQKRQRERVKGTTQAFLMRLNNVPPQETINSFLNGMRARHKINEATTPVVVAQMLKNAANKESRYPGRRKRLLGDFFRRRQSTRTYSDAFLRRRQSTRT